MLLPTLLQLQGTLLFWPQDHKGRLPLQQPTEHTSQGRRLGVRSRTWGWQVCQGWGRWGHRHRGCTWGRTPGCASRRQLARA